MLVLDVVEISRFFLERFLQEEPRVPPIVEVKPAVKVEVKPKEIKRVIPKQEHQIAHHLYAKWYREGHLESCSCSLLPTNEDTQKFQNSLLGQRAQILWRQSNQQGECTDLISPRSTCAGQALAVLITRSHTTPWKVADKTHVLFFQILEELRDYVRLDFTNLRSKRPEIGDIVHKTLQEMAALQFYKSRQLSLRSSTFVEEIEAVICDERVSCVYCHCILEGAPAHAISISLEPRCFIYDMESGFVAFSNRQALLNDLQRYFAIQKNAKAPLRCIGLTLYSSKKSE